MEPHPRSRGKPLEGAQLWLAANIFVLTLKSVGSTAIKANKSERDSRTGNNLAATVCVCWPGRICVCANVSVRAKPTNEKRTTNNNCYLRLRLQLGNRKRGEIQGEGWKIRGRGLRTGKRERWQRSWHLHLSMPHSSGQTTTKRRRWANT